MTLVSLIIRECYAREPDISMSKCWTVILCKVEQWRWPEQLQCLTRSDGLLQRCSTCAGLMMTT